FEVDIAGVGEQLLRRLPEPLQLYPDPPSAQIQVPAAGQLLGHGVDPLEDLQEEGIERGEDPMLLAADEQTDQTVRLGGERGLAVPERQALFLDLQGGPRLGGVGPVLDRAPLGGPWLIAEGGWE